MARKFDLSLLPEAPDLSFEVELWAQGRLRVAGIDEAGRGALAGPVAAAAVILPPDPRILPTLEGVRDSKQMTPAQREFWAGRLVEASTNWATGFASHIEIDEMGIVAATCLAAQRALDQLNVRPDHLLLDWLHLSTCLLPQTSLVKGDSRSLSIASASVLAKTARDAVLRDLDVQFPGYGFAAHKGYATATHLEALQRLGPSPIHRMSFAPLKG